MLIRKPQLLFSAERPAKAQIIFSNAWLRRGSGSSFSLDADPDPAFHFDTDLDPASQNDPDTQH